MKTFEEALAMVYRELGPDKARDDEALRNFVEMANQFESLMQEALQNEDLQAMITDILEMVAKHEMNPRSALMTAFANGLRCGIEMERQPVEKGAK
jgi:gamma-glutamyl:cysteine ligase YbdK (ATP-grasp superfamily)